MKKKTIGWIVVGAVVLGVGGWYIPKWIRNPTKPGTTVRDEQWILSGESPVRVMDQGWSKEDADWFYTTSQGSKLMPYEWFISMKTADGSGLLWKELGKYGYIPRRQQSVSGSTLPIGFAIDGEENEHKWVGLTCAACHTAVIEFGGKSLLIDGGPSLGDAETLLRDLVTAMEATLDDETRFKEFAAAVSKLDFKEEENTGLADLMKKQIEIRRSYNDRNLSLHPAPVFGPGRVDAFGAILNEVTEKFAKVKNSHKPANAPVSYPHLWDTPHQDVVQWNGSVPNASYGDLARNVGEVLGVFGEVQDLAEARKGYGSSVRISNLRAIEDRVKKLKSPVWPGDFFRELKPELAAKGKAIYAANCNRCHHDIEFDRTLEGRKITAEMVEVEEVKTDDTMVRNARTRWSPTGVLEGKRVDFLLGSKFGATAPATDFVRHISIGVILGGWKEAPEDEMRRNFDTSFVAKSLAPDRYKARPLNGIWATGPFLHNGSVPDLVTLLTKPDEREKGFWTGSREFDQDKVGFKTEKSQNNKQWFDATAPGNLNTGHDYGTSLKPEEKEALLEYLRSL